MSPGMKLGPDSTAESGKFFFLMKISKIYVVSESPAPPQPKSMSETKYLDSKDFPEKIGIFSKNIFRNISPKFRHLKIQISRPGEEVCLDRPDLEI